MGSLKKLNEMSDKQSDIKKVALGFAIFLDTECIKGVNGWYLIDALNDEFSYEFMIDELYDYWRATLINDNGK
jgi:hypothetical protein